jgi:hypothetical protein
MEDKRDPAAEGGLLYSALRGLQTQLTDLKATLTALAEDVRTLREGLGARAKVRTVDSEDRLKADLVSAVQSHWTHDGTPMSRRLLGQRFGKRAQSLGRSLEEVCLELEVSGKVRTLITYSHSRYQFPPDVFARLTAEQREHWKRFGASDKEAERAQALRAPELRPEPTEADLEAAEREAASRLSEDET